MDNVFIRPRLLADGEHGYVAGAGNRAVVPDPVSRLPLDPAGGNKPLDQYWAARLRDGDVEVVMDVGAAQAAPLTPTLSPQTRGEGAPAPSKKPIAD